MLGFTPHGHGQVEHCLRNQNPRDAAVLMEVRVSAAGAGPVGLNPVCHGQLLVAFMCADLILMMKCWLPPCWASHQGAIIILYLKVNILVKKTQHYPFNYAKSSFPNKTADLRSNIYFKCF